MNINIIEGRRFAEIARPTCSGANLVVPPAGVKMRSKTAKGRNNEKSGKGCI